ncbi:hypothetical protein HZP71_11695 [Elizabethkingia anophelis]|nr:hypothetical protein [Elizabethkingia anophelis]MCT4123302.1 hypothetical protein [Elizabethkingia anophelis]MDV3866884.1 hypothetical protein [Elizabethkingia anophelis]
MKRIIFLTIFLLGIYFNAQVVSLTSATNLSTGMYLKDLDNILSPFVGEWTAKYEKNQVILRIEKVEKFFFEYKEQKLSYHMDILFLRYTIKDSSGKEIFSTLNKKVTDDDALLSDSASPNIVGFLYSGEGEGCHVGKGMIHLTYKNPTHMSWEYISDDEPIDKSKCPSTDNIKSYIPKSYELIFTKQ